MKYILVHLLVVLIMDAENLFRQVCLHYNLPRVLKKDQIEILSHLRVCLKIKIHEIQKMYEIHYLKIEIHKIH